MIFLVVYLGHVWDDPFRVAAVSFFSIESVFLWERGLESSQIEEDTSIRKKSVVHLYRGDTRPCADDAATNTSGDFGEKNPGTAKKAVPEVAEKPDIAVREKKQTILLASSRFPYGSSERVGSAVLRKNKAYL